MDTHVEKLNLTKPFVAVKGKGPMDWEKGGEAKGGIKNEVRKLPTIQRKLQLPPFHGRNLRERIFQENQTLEQTNQNGWEWKSLCWIRQEKCW